MTKAKSLFISKKNPCLIIAEIGSNHGGSFEKAKLFQVGAESNNEFSYMQNIYLTNPAVKNNLSFEFELIGLTNVLTPIDNIIENGLFN